METTIGMPAALVLLLLVFVLAMLIGTNIGQQIFELLKPYIGGYGSFGATHDDDVAYRSTQVLWCAINSVAKGTPDDCIRDYGQATLTGSIIAIGWFSRGGPGFVSDNGLSGMATNPLENLNNILPSGGTGSDSNKNVDTNGWDKKEVTWLKCEKEEKEIRRLYGPKLQPPATESGASDGIPSLNPGNPIGNSVPSDIESECKTAAGNNYKVEFGHASVVVGTSGGEKQEYICYSEGVKCEVNNFRLPQYISDSEAYISTYGDPLYLLYWNVFPASENTWDFEVDWKMHLAMFAISIIPPSRVAGIGFRTLLAGLRGPGKSILVKELAEIYIKQGATKEAAEQAVEYYLKSGGTKLIRQKFMQYATDYSAKDFMKKVARDSMIETLTQRFKTKFGALRMVTKLGTLEGATMIAQLVDNMNAKNEPVGNAIAIKKSMEVGGQTEKFPLTGDWSDKPVILKSVPGLSITEYKPFHLVSPCYLDSLTIERQPMICGFYSNAPSNKNSYCMEAAISDFDSTLMECGIWNSKVDEFIGSTGLYNKINDWSKLTNRKIFDTKETSSITETTRVYFPWLDPKIYLDVEHAKLITSPESDEDATGDIYEAGLYYSSSQNVIELSGTKDEVVAAIAQKALDCFKQYYDKDAYCATLSTSKLAPDMEISDTDVRNWLDANGGSEGKDLVGTGGILDRNNLFWGFSDPSWTYKSIPIKKDTPKYILIRASTEATNGVHIEPTDNADVKLKTLNILCEFERTNSISNTLGMTDERTPTGACYTELKSDLQSKPIEPVYVDMIGSTEDGDDGLKSTESVGFDINGNKDKTVSFIDNNGDGNWESIEASNSYGLLYTLQVTGPTKNSVMLSDIKTDGAMGHIEMTNCQTTGVVVDVSSFDAQRSKDIKTKNYCFYHESKFTSGLKVAEGVVAVAAVVGAIAIMKSPAPAAILIGFLVGTSAAVEGLDIAVEYNKAWPGPTGSSGAP